MTATLTVRPVDARRRGLPVRCPLSLKRQDRLVKQAVCASGGDVRFDELLLHQVYHATATPSLFKTTAQLMPIDASDRSDTLLCLAHPTHVEPQLPAFPQLDSALRSVLDRSDALDTERISERALPDRETSTRSFDERTVGNSRVIPGRAISETGIGGVRWDGLTAEQQAGLLNLFAKMRSVTLSAGRTVWSHVDTIVEVQRDRTHAMVHADLFGRVQESACFVKADGLLHSEKPGFRRVRSFKTREPFGNLQLTFFAKVGETQPTLVDADVDDAAGIEHAEQVIRNESLKLFRLLLGDVFANLPEGKTHPYEIHQILIFHQRGDRAGGIGAYTPCYLLRVRDAPFPHSI